MTDDEPMPEKEPAPDWCGYFSAEEYAAFRAEVLESVGCYGVDEDMDYVESLDGGLIVMLVGDENIEGWLGLEGLAARCRDSPRDQWGTICFGYISDWVEGRLHREWLVRTPFAEVEPLLRVWRLSDEPEILYQGGRPDDPGEPFSIPLAKDLYLSLIADVPELAEAAGAAVVVPNAAVRAWQRSPEELLEVARRRLRDLPPPTWSTRTVRFKNYQGPTEVELHVATADPDADGVPVSAWLLLIDEVFPHRLPRGAYVVLPDRHSLIVALNEEREVASDPCWALFCVTNKGYEEAYSHHRGTRQLFAFGNLKPFRGRPWPERWTSAATS